MTKRIKIIINPIAGSGKAEKFVEHLKNALTSRQIESDVKFTSQYGDAQEIANKHTEDTPILCLGGDGTFNEIINGLITNRHFTENNRPIIGLIPFGSGNVIAKELQLKRNIRHFIGLYQNNLYRQLDIGCVRFIQENKKRYFISMAGIGFDAEVARQYQLDRNGAKLQAHLFSYFPITIKTIFRYKMPRITIQIEGKIVSRNASFVQVANVRSYGGPFVLVNNAIFDDGFLDVVWFKGKSPLNIIRYYSLAFLGCTNIVHDMKQKKTKEVVLSLSDDEASSVRKVPIQVDGDWCGYLPIQIEIIPKGIRVYTPLESR
ncbi:MAG: diacylglycerol kinase family protein [Planctomycetota bacterium]